MARATAQASPAAFIAYSKALALLSDRLGATPEEIAAWVWLGPENGGLAAYLRANELDPPPRFYYDLGNGKDSDYLSPLLACWFRKEELTTFDPTDHFMTGEALIERWSKQPGIEPKAFIQAKIAESRLLDIHPIFGATQGTSPEDDWLPPIESGLFVVSHVEAIETEDFGHEHDVKETPAERKQRLQAWFNKEVSRGKRGALARTAKREGITRQTLAGILKR